VGTAAIQLARRVDDIRIVGTASGHKRDHVLAQGADQFIDYRTADWVAQVREAHPGGVDLVLDSVGEESFARSIGVLGYGGRVVGFGLAAAMRDDSSLPDLEQATAGAFPLDSLLENASGFIGCHLGAPAAVLREWLRQLIDLCDKGLIKPHIDRVFALADAAEAHRYLHSRRSVGKLLLTV
jgi:NADPH:quinone reductase-like Zn-dependent oxidoreductase